jgi:hypothetical protein
MVSSPDTRGAVARAPCGARPWRARGGRPRRCSVADAARLNLKRFKWQSTFLNYESYSIECRFDCVLFFAEMARTPSPGQRIRR